MRRRGLVATLSIGLAVFVLGIRSGHVELRALTPDAAPVELTFLNISDWHAQLDPLPNPVAGQPAIGGAAVISAYWQLERAAFPNTFTFTAGDAFGASPPLSRWFNDEPAVLALGLMGLQADTFGNHNFNAGTSYLQRLIDLASYKFIASNLGNLDGNLENVHKRQTFRVGGVKVGVVGIVNEEAPVLVPSGAFGTITVAESAAAAMEAQDRLRRSGATVVIAIVHKGISGIGADGRPFGPLVDFADAVSGFDVIFGDHTDVQFAGAVNGQWVVENRSKGMTYARTQLTVDPDGGVSPPTTTFVTPLVNAVTPDQAVIDVLAPYRAQLGAMFNTVVATSMGIVPRSDACGRADGRLCESRVGNVTTDSMRLTYGTDFAITNAGGLRAALTCPATDLAGDFCPPYDSPPPPYVITRGQVNTVLPFGNEVVTLAVTGAELKTMLENGVSSMPGANGRFAQVSGLCFTYDIAQPAGSRLVDAVRQAADGSCTGDALDFTAASSYTLASNDFIAAGGDGYPNVLARAVTRDLMDQVLADYLAANAPITPAIQGRVACTSSNPVVSCPAITAP